MVTAQRSISKITEIGGCLGEMFKGCTIQWGCFKNITQSDWQLSKPGS